MQYRSYTITNYSNSPASEFVDFVGLALRQNYGYTADDFPALVPFVGPPITAKTDSDQYVSAVLQHTGWAEPDVVEHDGEFITMFYKV